MKGIIWNILEWIDTYINHGIADRILNQFPESNLAGSIWLKTCWSYCCWVHDEAYEWSIK